MSTAICRNPQRAASRNKSSHQSFETFISSGKACVTELANVEGEKLTTISAGLKTLHDVRLVKRWREAKHISYSLSDAHILRFVESAMDHAAERRKRPVSRERKRERDNDYLHREASSQS
jgi:ArsR family transcriptional regulator, lead/cadmium/zinc/bismuth-responsive transcriptional repressor